MRPRVSRQLRCPKVSKGRAESPLVLPQAHAPCPGWGLTRRLRRGSGARCPLVFSPALVPEGFQRASGKPFGAPAGAHPLPPDGGDAPTTAREQGLPPYGAFTLFFRWRKKSVQKKASGTATPGKSPLLPIFERGSSQCRAQNCWRDNTYVRARSCSLLSSFKKGKAFSLRCLSPLFPPQLA